MGRRIIFGLLMVLLVSYIGYSVGAYMPRGGLLATPPPLAEPEPDRDGGDRYKPKIFLAVAEGKDFKTLFQEQSVPQWRYVLSRINALYFFEDWLSQPTPKGRGKSDEELSQVLQFCARHGIKIAVVGGFGGLEPPCQDPSPEFVNPATLSAKKLWEQEPRGSGKPHWDRLVRLLERNRIPRSLVIAFVFDSPFMYTFHTCSFQPTEKNLLHFAREMQLYFNYARALFPGLIMIEEEPYTLQQEEEFASDPSYFDRNIDMWLHWIKAYKRANGKPQDAIELDVARWGDDPNVSYDPPYDKPFFVKLRELETAIRRQGTLVGIEIQDTNARIMEGKKPKNNQSAAQEMENWARVYLAGYGGRPDFLTILPYNGRPNLNLPEVTAKRDKNRDFTVTQVARDLIANIVAPLPKQPEPPLEEVGQAPARPKGRSRPEVSPEPAESNPAEAVAAEEEAAPAEESGEEEVRFRREKLRKVLRGIFRRTPPPPPEDEL